MEISLCTYIHITKKDDCICICVSMYEQISPFGHLIHVTLFTHDTHITLLHIVQNIYLNIFLQTCLVLLTH